MTADRRRRPTLVEAQVHDKVTALQDVRDAFICSPAATSAGGGSREARPTAPDYLLGEACAAAKARKADYQRGAALGGELITRTARGSQDDVRVAGGDHERCLLRS